MEPQQNPLLNSLILPDIFQYCKVDDLRTVREVCRLWYETSQEAWCHQLLLVVDQESPIQEAQAAAAVRNDNNNTPPATPPPEAPRGTPCAQLDLEELEGVPSKTYRKFVIRNWDMAMMSEVASGFWNERGRWMRELYLKHCSFPSVSSFMSILLEKAPSLEVLSIDEQVFPVPTSVLRQTEQPPPDSFGAKDLAGVIMQRKLKSLTVTYSSSSRRQFLAVSWLKFLIHFPNLEKVVINYSAIAKFWDGKFSDMNSLFTAIKSIQLLDPTRAHLQHLEILGSEPSLDCEQVHVPRFRPQNLASLIRSDLILPLRTLRTLKLELGSTEFWPFLSKFHNSLETLQVIKPPEKYHVELGPLFSSTMFTQTMSSLHTLEIIGNGTFNMSFLQFTPNLRKLIITPIHVWQYYNEKCAESGCALGRTYRRQLMDTDELASVDNLKELDVNPLVNLLELEIGYVLEDSASIELLSSWIPNVETLRIPSSPEVFVGICRQWGNSLKELRLLAPSSIDDQAVTGMGSTIRPRAASNIEALKELEVFKMDHPHPDWNLNQCSHLIPKLTERSIVDGFLYLEKLRILHIYLYERIGEKCRRKFEQRKIPFNCIMEVVKRCRCQEEAREMISATTFYPQ